MSMPIIKRVMQIVQEDHNMDADSLEKLVYMAYCIGRESATRKVSDRYNAKIAGMRDRANASRYHHVANRIIGNTPDHIYSADYAGDTTSIFGYDQTDL